jgi:hypothetical protein
LLKHEFCSGGAYIFSEDRIEEDDSDVDWDGGAGQMLTSSHHLDPVYLPEALPRPERAVPPPSAADRIELDDGGDEDRSTIKLRSAGSLTTQQPHYKM